jgi:hypothetical protein
LAGKPAQKSEAILFKPGHIFCNEPVLLGRDEAAVSTLFIPGEKADFHYSLTNLYQS